MASSLDVDDRNSHRVRYYPTCRLLIYLYLLYVSPLDCPFRLPTSVVLHWTCLASGFALSAGSGVEVGGDVVCNGRFITLKVLADRA